MLKIKRVYEPPSPSDGCRILVDGLWPRGLTRKRAAIHEWAKDLAPSRGLRRWFSHHPKRWAAFQLRYRAELRLRRRCLVELARETARERTTLVFAAKDIRHNNAVVLKGLLLLVSSRMPQPESSAWSRRSE
jgi:uncharacterized protein YeaO (DUF488 family)